MSFQIAPGTSFGFLIVHSPLNVDWVSEMAQLIQFCQPDILTAMATLQNDILMCRKLYGLDGAISQCYYLYPHH